MIAHIFLQKKKRWHRLNIFIKYNKPILPYYFPLMLKIRVTFFNFKCFKNCHPVNNPHTRQLLCATVNFFLYPAQDRQLQYYNSNIIFFKANTNCEFVSIHNP